MCHAEERCAPRRSWAEPGLRWVVVVHAHRSDFEQVHVAVNGAAATSCGTIDDDDEEAVAPRASVLRDPGPKLLSQGGKEFDGACCQVTSVDHEQRRRAGRGVIDQPGGGQFVHLMRAFVSATAPGCPYGDLSITDDTASEAVARTGDQEISVPAFGGTVMLDCGCTPGDATVELPSGQRAC